MFHHIIFVDKGGKTLRQLSAEEDDEERFQADLKKAVRESLGVSSLSLSLADVGCDPRLKIIDY